MTTTPAHSSSKPTLQQHIENYRRDGYTVLERLFCEEEMARWRRKYHELNEESVLAGTPTTWFGNMLEASPALMWPIVSKPEILDVLQAVMGPFVQLDNLTLATFASMPKDAAAGKVSGWHRDRWGNLPDGHYHRPLASNAISYLQDLTDEYGPLRVIPGSHIEPIAIPDNAKGIPHPREVIIHAKAGDVIVTHNNLIHSGTPNSSGKLRYFFSIYYNHCWLKATDTYAGAGCQALIARARKQNDLRALRLLGIDDQLQARCNWGFQKSEESIWAHWLSADEAARVATP